MQTIRSRPVPVIKWAGGKRQLLSLLETRIPKRFGTYFEPFLGGGALFFHIQPEHAVLNDANHQLINMYRQIRSDATRISNHLLKWQNTYNTLGTDSAKLSFYLRQRRIYNNFLSAHVCTALSAALLIFLNKSGFNGLYRINKEGQYNVPSGHKKTLHIIDEDNFSLVSHALQKAELTAGDFESACTEAREGDFVFFDSPYYDTFDTYQAGGFSQGDHTRLVSLFHTLTRRKVFCLATNNDCDAVRDLYSSFPIEAVPVRRMINRDASHRTGSEVITRNFTDDDAIIE